MKNVNELLQVAAESGFQTYGSFNEGELQHEVLTCTAGDHSGDVIDIYYDWGTGDVSKVEISSQFIGEQPTFTF